MIWYQNEPKNSLNPRTTELKIYFVIFTTVIFKKCYAPSIFVRNLPKLDIDHFLPKIRELVLATDTLFTKKTQFSSC